MIGCSRKNRENHRRKCFGKKEKGIRIKFNHSLAPISFRTTGPRRIRLIIILSYNFIFKGSHRHYACPYFSSKEKLRKIIARTSLFSQTLELQYFSTFPFGEHVLPATYVANIFTKTPTAALISEYEAQTTTRAMATRISVKNAIDLNEHNNNFA